MNHVALLQALNELVPSKHSVDHGHFQNDSGFNY